MLFANSTMPAALALSPETVRLMWQTPLLGIGMVFAVLSCLWGVLTIFKLVFAGRTSKAPKAPKAPKTEQKVEQKAEPVAAPVVSQSTGDDAQLIAVITAAVAAYMAEEGTEYAGGFRVVSFKRVGGGRAWNSK